MNENDVREYFRNLNSTLEDKDCQFCPFREECDAMEAHDMECLCYVIGKIEK